MFDGRPDPSPSGLDRNIVRLFFNDDLRWGAIARWLAVGLAFLPIGLGLLYLLTDLLKLRLLWSTMLTGEVTTIARYAINDLWVFEQRRMSWKRLWQFHVANAAEFAIWWSVVNELPRLGIYYLLASMAGTGCSVLLSALTNFLWIWRRRAQTPGWDTAAKVANGK